MLDVKNIFIYITMLGMEFSWLYAVLNAANKSVADKLAIPLLMSALLISFGVSAGLRYLHWPKFTLTSLSWLIWPIVMLLMIKVQLFPDTAFSDSIWLASIPYAFSQILHAFEPALLILISTGVLWWLGRRLAYTRANFSASVAEFQFGLIILTLTFFICYELKLDQSSSLPIALSFFSLALISISISHAQDNHSWLSSWRQGRWSTMLIVSIIIILLSGLLISIIATPDLLQVFLNALKWAWGMFERFMTWIASLLPQPSSPEPLPPAPTMPGMENPDSGGITLPEWLTTGGRIVWAILFIGLILAAAWQIASQIFKMMRRRAATAGGEVESLKGVFWRDFKNWLKHIISRINGIKFGIRRKGNLKDIPPEIASVRQLYNQFLRWAAEGGHPRKKWQTPAEFQVSLNETLLEDKQGVDFITGKYIDARYGAILPTEDELDQLKKTWHNLKQVEIKKIENKKSQKGG
jgi:hypothetical protein